MQRFGPSVAMALIAAASFHFEPAMAEEPLGIVFAVGDVQRRTDGDTKCLTTPMPVVEQISAELKLAAPGTPVRVLALGDLAYNHGTVHDVDCFMKSWEALLAVTLPVPGNHENDEKNPEGTKFDKQHGQRHMRPYLAALSRFPLLSTNADPQGDFAHVDRGYYFTDLPPRVAGDPAVWRFMALNLYARDLDRQWTDLKTDLGAHKTVPCIIGFMHPFRLSSGYHGHGDADSPLAKKVTGSSAKTPFENLLEAGASLLLSGHDHHYEQFARTDVNGEPRPDGLRSFIVGSGGFPDRPPFAYTKHTWGGVSEDLRRNTTGVLKLELFDKHYRWQFLPGGGPPGTVHVDTCNSRR